MSSSVTTFERRFTVPNFCIHWYPEFQRAFSLFICSWFVFCSLASIIIDDSNDASMPTHEEDVMETSVMSQALNKVNPLYATIWWRPSFQDLNLRNNCVPQQSLHS